MNNKLFFGIGLLSLVLLAGCNSVDVKNGEVPEAMVPLLEPALGTYTGDIRIVSESFGHGGGMGASYPGSVQLALEGRRLRLIAEQDWAHLWNGANCQSEIGSLRSLGYDEKTGLYSATFDFLPNECYQSIGVTYVRVFIKKENGAYSRISTEVEFANYENWVGGESEFVTESAKGKFTRTVSPAN